MESKASAVNSKSSRYGVARVISKMGLTSRTQAARWVDAGRVKVNGRVISDPQFPIRQGIDRIEIDEQALTPHTPVAVMLNKPRGLVTTASDEQGRDTVYSCLDGADLPWLAPVGRLDKASEGLLLFTNHPEWAARITAPEVGVEKTYHVQINRIPDARLLAGMVAGVIDGNESLSVKSARALRAGMRNSWIEVVLVGGKNRHIRRLMTALDVSVLRLVRVSIGTLCLGALPKGKWRMLTDAEFASFAATDLHR